jgi:Flp pilus assembly protein CpaB
LKRSNRLILLIGVFLAALAFVLVVILLGGKGAGTGTPATNVPPAKVPVVVAARNIALGVTITTDMVATQDVVPTAVLAGAFAAPSQVIGQVIRQSLTEGQQLTAGIFSQTNQSFEVPAGFSAIAVQVDQVTGAGTLIQAGDYVDVVAQISPAFPLVLANGSICAAVPPQPQVPDACYDHTSVKVLLQGIQVVATLLPPPPAAADGAAPAAPTDGTTALNGQQEIVLLAVTQQQAEVIKFAQADGGVNGLSLTLRSPKDFVDASGNPIVPVTVKTTGLILKTMIDSWGVLPPFPIFIQP